jgi:hypothetical protein
MICARMNVEDDVAVLGCSVFELCFARKAAILRCTQSYIHRWGSHERCEIAMRRPGLFCMDDEVCLRCVAGIQVGRIRVSGCCVLL